MLKDYHKWIHEHHVAESVLVLCDWITKEFEYWQIAYEMRYGITSDNRMKKAYSQFNGNANVEMCCTSKGKQNKDCEIDISQKCLGCFNFRLQIGNRISVCKCKENSMISGCKENYNTPSPRLSILKETEEKGSTTEAAEGSKETSKKPTAIPQKSFGIIENTGKEIEGIEEMSKKCDHVKRKPAKKFRKEFRAYQVGNPWKEKNILNRKIDAYSQFKKNYAEKEIQKDNNENIFRANSTRFYPTKAGTVLRATVAHNLDWNRQLLPVENDARVDAIKDSDDIKSSNKARLMDKLENYSLDHKVINTNIGENTATINLKEIAKNSTLKMGSDNCKKLLKTMLNDGGSIATSKSDCAKLFKKLRKFDKAENINSMRSKDIADAMSSTNNLENTLMNDLEKSPWSIQRFIE